MFEALPPDVRGASESVTAVDALQDGRVAVGLRCCAHRVALLVRDASGGVRQSWRLDGTVVELQSRPLRLAVHGSNVVAVAESFPTQLVLASLPPLESGRGSSELLRRKWDYVISSVATTAQVVITAGLAKATLPDGREGYLLECYSHSGEHLWRQLRSSEVLDMCAAAAGRFQSSSSVTAELCLLLKGSSVVTALRASDGQLLLLHTHDEVIASPSDGSKSPMQLLQLSLCSPASQTTVLAALAGDRKTVVVHRRDRSALLDRYVPFPTSSNVTEWTSCLL